MKLSWFHFRTCFFIGILPAQSKSLWDSSLAQKNFSDSFAGKAIWFNRIPVAWLDVKQMGLCWLIHQFILLYFVWMETVSCKTHSIIRLFGLIFTKRVNWHMLFIISALYNNTTMGPLTQPFFWATLLRNRPAYWPLVTGDIKGPRLGTSHGCLLVFQSDLAFISDFKFSKFWSGDKTGMRDLSLSSYFNIQAFTMLDKIFKPSSLIHSLVIVKCLCK